MSLSRVATIQLLIFDAPKQHELSQADFDVYMDRMKELAERHPGRVQVVFSVADLKTHFRGYR